MELTAQQALEQGYEYYVYPDDRYQALKCLTDDDVDFKRNPMIVGKESHHPSGLSPDELYDTIADRCWENWNEITGDDTDQVHDLIKEIDFSELSEKIQFFLNSLNYYKQSDIKLIESLSNN